MQPVNSICLHCSKALVGRQKKWCSTICQATVWQRIKRGYVKPYSISPVFNCSICSMQFKRKKMFCSQKCRQKAYRNRSLNQINISSYFDKLKIFLGLMQMDCVRHTKKINGVLSNINSNKFNKVNVDVSNEIKIFYKILSNIDSSIGLVNKDILESLKKLIDKNMNINEIKVDASPDVDNTTDHARSEDFKQEESKSQAEHC